MKNTQNTEIKNNIIHLPSWLVTMEDHDQNPPEKIETQTRDQNTLYIATYNVRTLSTYSRLLELTKCLKNISFDIFGLSETRKLGNTIEEHDEFILYYIGETPGLHGVGFIVKKYLKKFIKSFIGLSERVAVVLVLLMMNIYQWLKIKYYSSLRSNGGVERRGIGIFLQYCRQSFTTLRK